MELVSRRKWSLVSTQVISCCIYEFEKQTIETVHEEQQLILFDKWANASFHLLSLKSSMVNAYDISTSINRLNFGQNSIIIEAQLCHFCLYNKYTQSLEWPLTGYELLTFVVRSSQRVHWTLVLSSIFTLVINWVPENNNEIVLCLHLFALCFYLYFEVLWGLNLDRDVTTWLPVSSLTFNYSLNGFTSTLKLLYLKWLGPSRMSFLFCIRSRCWS